MTPKKNILEDYLNYNLSEDALDELKSDEVTLQKIDVAQVSDKLSKEFFRPGYETFMADKQEEFRGLITDVSDVPNHQSAKPSDNSKRNILVLVLSAVLIGALFLLIKSFKQDQPITIDEVKQYALLSYESTGALNANRGTDNAPNQLSINYDLLVKGACNELVLNGKYLEQELWSQLYCAYLNNDDAMIDNYKSKIIEKKYGNYSKLK